MSCATKAMEIIRSVRARVDVSEELTAIFRGISAAHYVIGDAVGVGVRAAARAAHGARARRARSVVFACFGRTDVGLPTLVAAAHGGPA